MAGAGFLGRQAGDEVTRVPGGFAILFEARGVARVENLAEGWGTFRQRRDGDEQREIIELNWGKLRSRSLAFMVPKNIVPKNVRVAAKPAFRHRVHGETLIIELADDDVLEAGQKLEIIIA